MNRRELLKVSALVAAPACALASTEYVPDYMPAALRDGTLKTPANASELYAEINKLFASMTSSSPDDATGITSEVFGMKWGAEDDVNSGRAYMESKAARALWFLAVAKYEQGARAIFWRRTPEIAGSLQDDFLVLQMRVAFI